MKHCPNATCPHRRANREPAEFRDHVAACSDCGTALVDGDAPSDETTASPRAPASLWLRLAATFVPAVLLIVLLQVALPGLDRQTLREAGSTDLPESASLAALGITPWVSGFVLVELVALGVPRLRALRTPGGAGRAKLVRASYLLGFALACLQAFAIGVFLQSRSMVPAGESSARLEVMAALVGGSAVLVGAAAWATRRATANALSVLLASSIAGALIADARAMIGLLHVGAIAPPAVVVYVAALAIVPVATAYLLGVRTGVATLREGVGRAPFREPPAVMPELKAALRAPTSGLIPVALAAGLLRLPAALRLYGVALPDPIAPFRRDPTGTLAIELAVALVFTVALSYAFNRPRDVARLLKQFGAASGGASVVRVKVRRALRRATLRTMLFVVAVYFARWLATRAAIGTVFPDALLLASLSAVALDLRAEWRFRMQHGALALAWTEHRVYAVELVCEALRANGVEALPRAAQHRALLQFFGPYVPVEVLVPEAQLDAAREVLVAATRRSSARTE